MTNSRSNLLTVGRITGVFGIKGWVKVKSHTRPEDSILEYQPWWVKTRHGVKEVEIAQQQMSNKGLMVRLEGVEDRTAAEDYIRCDIAVEKQVLPELDDQDFYWHQLVGLNVVSCSDGQEIVLGKVDHLIETGANDVLVVKPTATSIDDQERLVPYVFEQYVLEVNLDSEVIKVDWDPEF